MAEGTYVVGCWNCMNEFDALAAVWCSCDPKNPSKLCQFCFRCFCEASEKYKQEFWKRAPQRLVDELQILAKSKDRLGDVLIRMKKITVQQLLEALTEQKNTSKRLGDILVARRLVTQADIDAALRSQGTAPLMNTQGMEVEAAPVYEGSSPEAILDYVISLAARRGASDVQLEPRESEVGVKCRIDGFFFRVDPIPKSFEGPVFQRIHTMFKLDPAKKAMAQLGRAAAKVGETDFDLVVQTLPTAQGLSATIKLVNRATFLKDFASLGLELDDRVRLIEELRGSFGLVLLTAPPFNGAYSTMYSVMNFLVQGQRDVVSLEAPVNWHLEGARQVRVESPARLEEALRSVMAVRPEVLVLSAVPDRATAQLAAQLASSILVLAVMPAQSSAQAVNGLVDLGVPAQVVAGSLAAVVSQRLVRQICRICAGPTQPPAPQTLAFQGLSPEDVASMRFFRGKGCPKCNRVGYRGRRAIFEVMSGAPEVRAAILNGLSAPELESMAVGTGMRPLRDRCLDLVRDGTTTFDEFVRLRL